jgi:hypothetical protein
MTILLDLVVGPISCLMASPVDFFLPSSSTSQRSDVAKILGSFDVQKVPESKKHAKARKSASQC